MHDLRMLLSDSRKETQCNKQRSTKRKHGQDCVKSTDALNNLIAEVVTKVCLCFAKFSSLLCRSR